MRLIIVNVSYVPNDRASIVTISLSVRRGIKKIKFLSNLFFVKMKVRIKAAQYSRVILIKLNVEINYGGYSVATELFNSDLYYLLLLM